MSRPGWAADAFALLEKDFRAELRTRVAMSAVGVFAFAALLLIALAMATLKDARSAPLLKLPDPVSLDLLSRLSHPAWDPISKLGLLWVLLCFSAFAGLSHSFLHEEESGTTTALRLTMRSGSVFAGKYLFNLILLVLVALIITPVYMVLTGMESGSPLVFLCVMVCGCVGLSAVATIVAALAAKAHSSGALYGAIGLPLLVVFLLMLLNAGSALYAPEPGLIATVRAVGGLLSYGILILAVSALTFQFVWEE